MEASVRSLSAARRAFKAESISIPWFVYAALFGSTSIVIGGYWDISWHQSIGRDTFWSPPHLAIYLGGVVAGVSSGWTVLKSTFGGDASSRAGLVQLWGFRGPLGAFFCIWGAFAMLTSAPFDDWWHSAYGLDTEILSPPHVVLALGIAAIQVGALIEVLALQNRSEQLAGEAEGTSLKRRARLRVLYAYAAGMLLANASVMAWTYMYRTLMHSSIFYQVGCGVFPLFLVAVARASNLRWPATVTAAIYMSLWIGLMWLLPLFPAEPKLGPVLQPVTHMVPLEFPFLLVVPGLAIDLLMRRMGEGRDWRLAAALGFAFFAALLASQWPFGSFLMSEYSRNWVFATHRFPYYFDPSWGVTRYEFYQWDSDARALLLGLAFAIPLAIISARVGLLWGNWMRRVQR
jgi:hypothetical protein